MAAMYSMQFRRAVAKACDERGSSGEVAEQFECSASWVRRLIPRRRETAGLARGTPAPAAEQPQARRARPRPPGGALIARTPEMTLAELAAARETKVSVSTVWRARRRRGWSSCSSTRRGGS